MENEFGLQTPLNLSKPASISTQIAMRVLAELRLKLILLVALNLWVFLPYHYLQQHHFARTREIVPSPVDDLIPFLAQAVWAYLSIYLLMPIGPFLMNRRAQLLRYAAGILLTGAAADSVFTFWPTLCPRPSAESANAIYRALTAIDNPFHACPSLHASFAVYSALCCDQVFREMRVSNTCRAGVWFWASVILLATLLTKQHMFVDVVAGIALGLGSYSIVFYRRDRSANLNPTFPEISTTRT